VHQAAEPAFRSHAGAAVPSIAGGRRTYPRGVPASLRFWPAHPRELGVPPLRRRGGESPTAVAQVWD